MSDELFLQTRGAEIVTRSGTPVILKGTALGGWMNMENYITGYAGTESQMRASVRRALGDELYHRFFDRFLDVFFTDEDAAYMASLNFNHVRLPISYRHFEDDMAPFELKSEGFVLLDRAIERAARHGLYSIIDLHALPGFHNQYWITDNPTHKALFWEHKHFQDRVVHLWEAIAGRYRGNPWVAGYDLMNEPGDVEGETVGPFYERLRDAVWAVDPDHILFVEGNRFAREFTIFSEPWRNTVYGFHHYPRCGGVNGGEYPGYTRGEYIDRGVIEEQFLERTAFMRETGSPIWLGEFGPVFVGDERSIETRYRMLEDQIELATEYGASWSMFTYKDVGVMGLVYADPESAYLERIRPALEKKLRLGADWWGSTDANIRHVMAPLEETFGLEFPGFDPFPFGRQAWLELLVRSIMLAEPLAEEFGDCFKGATAGELDAMADSFRLDRCVKRERLAELLARM